MATSLQITWLGHGTFLLVTPAGRRILVDPWFQSPTCPPELAKPEAVMPLDMILVTHGHQDHITDLVSTARVTGAPVVCIWDMGLWLGTKGLKNVKDMGVGGTQAIGGVQITMVPAVHSSGFLEDGKVLYMGTAAGFVLREEGMPTVYFAGDTTLFSDMKIIRDLYRPEIAFLPIGDHYTMGPDLAAIAAEWLEVRQVVPMHYGTFPLLTGTPDALRAHLEKTKIDVLELEPGQTAK